VGWGTVGWAGQAVSACCWVGHDRGRAGPGQAGRPASAAGWGATEAGGAGRSMHAARQGEMGLARAAGWGRVGLGTRWRRGSDG
jgi:hypothetical protein